MLEPLIYGDYPDVMKRTIGSRLPVFSKEESEQVKGSSDFIGVIHYLTALVTNIDINPSLSGIPDFNSDMGESINILSMRVRISRLPNSDEKCLIFFITLSIPNPFLLVVAFVFVWTSLLFLHGLWKAS
jgi:hypothetical protein